MVCDRASNALNFFMLAMLYPNVDFLFFGCFVLDFGSHFLHFQSAALMKETSHKGSTKTNWLVGLYYKSYPIFATTVAGTEVGAVLLMINAKSEYWSQNIGFQIVTAIFSMIMTFKMFVNLHQWQGGLETLKLYQKAKAQ